MATIPTPDDILTGLYDVMNILEAIADMGCSTNASARITPTYRFGKLAGLLATQLANRCSDLSDYLAWVERRNAKRPTPDHGA